MPLYKYLFNLCNVSFVLIMYFINLFAFILNLPYINTTGI